MVRLQFLMLAMVGLTVAPGYAVPVVFTLEGESFTQWEFAQRDSAGMITSMDVADANGDGVASFVAEVVFGKTSIGVQGTSVPASDSGYLGYLAADDDTGDLFGSTIPFLRSVAGDSLIVEWLDAPSAMFSLGQPVTVSNGMVVGLDGVVHENPGIISASDLLGIDVPSLPTFMGAAEVVGLMTVQVIPEPSTAALVAVGLIGAGCLCLRHNRSDREQSLIKGE